MIIKKLHRTLNRHPFLYLTRFRLLSRNSSPAEIASISYNTINRKNGIPRIFLDINQEIFQLKRPRSDLALVKQLVAWLCEHTHVGPGLSKSSHKAIEIMVHGKGGVCSDTAQIFNNFCVINDIKVREWGTTCTPFNPCSGGHSFNEVYITELKKWILVDASWGGFFYDEHDRPLSVIELYQLSRAGSQVNYQSIIKNKMIDTNLVAKNYLDANITPFLICNYRNAIYDHYLTRARPILPIFMIHFILYILGKSYHYKFPLDNYKHIFA